MRIGDFVEGISTKGEKISGIIRKEYRNELTKSDLLIIENPDSGKCFPGHFLKQNFKIGTIPPKLKKEEEDETFSDRIEKQLERISDFGDGLLEFETRFVEEVSVAAIKGEETSLKLDKLQALHNEQSDLFYKTRVDLGTARRGIATLEKNYREIYSELKEAKKQINQNEEERRLAE